MLLELINEFSNGAEQKFNTKINKQKNCTSISQESLRIEIKAKLFLKIPLKT